MTGRHKVFLGMAAGVGKTFRMLAEGHAEAEAGRDVVIGYLEPHDRPETAAQATGLPVVPRLHGELGLGEMDIEAVLARAPELVLVDELAHTGPRGQRSAEVTRLLDAGLDVYSTVNVQHLESVNDVVCDLTGVRVRETLPDAVLGRANEVVLVDLTPEALIVRLRAGKVYPPERVPAALNGFFKIESLAALREVALRQVAEDVGARSPHRRVGERLLALVEPDPASQRIVRRAWRSAQRLGADLDLLWVAPPGAADPGALRRLAAILGATLLIEEGDLLDVVRRTAAERGTTYVLLGTPTSRAGRRRLLHLVEALEGVDLRVVADRSRRP